MWPSEFPVDIEIYLRANFSEKKTFRRQSNLFSTDPCTIKLNYKFLYATDFFNQIKIFETLSTRLIKK